MEHFVAAVEGGTLTFSFLLYVSLELKFYVFLLLFPAWETSHPDLMFFFFYFGTT